MSIIEKTTHEEKKIVKKRKLSPSIIEISLKNVDNNMVLKV